MLAKAKYQGQYLNTSHVTFYQNWTNFSGPYDNNLNTSHVTFYLGVFDFDGRSSTNLNTSHVTFYRNSRKRLSAENLI